MRVFLLIFILTLSFAGYSNTKNDKKWWVAEYSWQLNDSGFLLNINSLYYFYQDSLVYICQDSNSTFKAWKFPYSDLKLKCDQLTNSDKESLHDGNIIRIFKNKISKGLCDKLSFFEIPENAVEIDVPNFSVYQSLIERVDRKKLPPLPQKPNL